MECKLKEEYMTKQEINKRTWRLFCVLFGVCFAIVPSSVGASTLFFLPQSQDIYSGETFVLEARIDTEGRAINVIDGGIEYPSDKLEVVDIADGDSVVSLWVKKPAYNADKGEINFTGGVPRGFAGEGDIFKIVFKAKEGVVSGEEIKFRENTKVLLNDGSGTEDQLKYASSDFKVSKKPAGMPVISSNSHPDQDSWYSEGNLNLRWDLVEGAEYSFLISRDPLAEVDEVPDKPEGELVWMGDMNYNGLEDGIYYFHLRQKLQGEGWSSKITFRAMIDSTAPERFTPKITEIEGKKYLVFNTRDAVSGIDHYEISEEKNRQIGDFNLDDLIPGSNVSNYKSWIVVSSPYLLRDQDLESNIYVKAIDRAGNETVADIFPKQKPVSIQIVTMLVVLVLAILAASLWFVFKRSIKRKHGKSQ